MEMDTSEVFHNKCLLCNEFTLEENAILLSDASIKNAHKELIESIVTQVLAQNCNDIILQSDIICKECFTTCSDVHEMELKVQQQKFQMMRRFKNTLKPTQLEMHSDDELSQGPKTILDIPSSDDDDQDEQVLIHSEDVIDYPSNDKKLKTIEEIEEELVKMHGPSDEVHIELLTKNNEMVLDDEKLQEFTTQDGEILVAEIVNERGIKIEAMDEDKSKILRKTLERTINIVKNNSKEDAIKQMKDELTVDGMVTRNSELYTCMMCEGDETVCGEAKAIMAHIKVAHDARIYICDICGDYFKKRTELSAHMDEHVAAEEGDFQCETCHRIFNNLRLFRIHKRMHLPQNKGWACDRCGKKYSSRNLLEEHMNTHTGFRPYVCNVCGKDFASKYTFRAHEKTHETRPRPHKCRKCPKSFLNIPNLIQHEKTHSGVKDYSCHLCEKKFGSSHNLEVHSIVHTGYRPFVCGLCGKNFARKAEVKDHERTHTGERPYQCEFCGATFSQRSNLQSHKRSTHYDDKRYKCPDCGKAFKRRRLLEYHVKAVHTGERPFQCTVCDATFVYPEHYKKHRRIHTGEKPFRCEVCGKAFNSRDNRNAHRFVHSDKKPYECLQCGCGFMRKPLLYQHMQTEGHLSDTIVVNQPRLPSDDEDYVTINPDGHLEITPIKVSRLEADLAEMEDMEEIEESLEEDSKLLIAEHMLVDDGKGLEGNQNAFLLGDGSEDAIDHIIIDGQRFQFKEDDEEDDEDEVEEEEETILTTTEDFEGIITPEAIASGQTQIIQTKDGPVQLLAVRIPNDNGEEEEAWIKILPENVVE